MSKTLSLEEFYENSFSWMPDDRKQGIGQFNVFKLEDCFAPGAEPIVYTRRDFYKITLIRGQNRYHYADKTLEVNGTALVFFNPQVPYTFEPVSGDTTGLFCIFKDAFFTESMRMNLNLLPMFTIGGKPSYLLNEVQDKYVNDLFVKMEEEINGDYIYKYDLLRNYVMELIHYALKLQPTEKLYQHPDANSRITSIFTELLERQFPIESPSQRFNFKSAKDIADKLAVHVNHLNRAVRKTTGKTTTAHIAERITSEAKALLKHTNWNVSEISYSLGFEEPAHFNNFFKKQTQLTPTSFRIV